MNTTATNQVQYSTKALLYLAFELGNGQWKLGFTIGLGQQPRQRTIPAGDLARLQQEVAGAKKRFRLAEPVRVVSCYEAGRDGFWLDRYLRSEGIENVIVDAASIEVNRRARRAKTDRLDLGKLLTMLIRYHSSEPKVWHVVQVPTLEQEDRRQLHRELLRLRQERTSHINRLKGLLVSQGLGSQSGFADDSQAGHVRRIQRHARIGHRGLDNHRRYQRTEHSRVTSQSLLLPHRD